MLLKEDKWELHQAEKVKDKAANLRRIEDEIRLMSEGLPVESDGMQDHGKDDGTDPLMVAQSIWDEASKWVFHRSTNDLRKIALAGNKMAEIQGLINNLHTNPRPDPNANPNPNANPTLEA